MKYRGSDGGHVIGAECLLIGEIKREMFSGLAQGVVNPFVNNHRGLIFPNLQLFPRLL